MIIINNSGDTNVITTFRTLANNKVNPIFTISATSKTTKKNVIFTSSMDLNCYYESFTLSIATNSIDYLNGIVDFTPGEWYFTAYEATNPLEISDNIVGYGCFRVLSSTSSIVKNYDSEVIIKSY
jgi:hypothetical protein